MSFNGMKWPYDMIWHTKMTLVLQSWYLSIFVHRGVGLNGGLLNLITQLHSIQTVERGLREIKLWFAFCLSGGVGCSQEKRYAYSDPYARQESHQNKNVILKVIDLWYSWMTLSSLICFFSRDWDSVLLPVSLTTTQYSFIPSYWLLLASIVRRHWGREGSGMRDV